MSKELLIFIGHSNDAVSEVKQIYDLQTYFQKILTQISGPEASWTSLRFFMWEADARLGMGGQKNAIHPDLQKSIIGLFVFKERVGVVTWQELEYCRNNNIPVIAIFPDSPPFPKKLRQTASASAWADLMARRDSLTKDWSENNSKSITPVDSYADSTHLIEIVKDKLQALIADIVHKEKKEEKSETLKVPRKYPHHLTDALPFMPELFMGRDDEPEKIKKRLFEENNFLLLVNGQGGIGKTSLAATYYHQFHNLYNCAAWVLNEQGIGNALLLLAPGLGLQFENNMDTNERVRVVLAAMAGLDKPCLLVIDNANEIDDLEQYYLPLRSCTNFHLLLTTRVTHLLHAKTYEVKGLPEDAALALFKEYYPGHRVEEDDLFKDIWLAADKNTLLTELIAKSMQQLNEHEVRYTLSDLLRDLQAKGLLAIQTGAVATTYGGKLKHVKPEHIISAMYDLGTLNEQEIDLLSTFAVLPPENIPYVALKKMLFENGSMPIPETLKSLYDKGWLSKSIIEGHAYYKVSPVIQDITRNKNVRLSQSTVATVSELSNLLEYEPSTGHLVNCSYNDAVVYTRYAESTVKNLETQLDGNLPVLMERIGRYYFTTGNLPLALEYFEKYTRAARELYEAKPNAFHKGWLAISYLKLGDTQTTLGNLPLALDYYEKYTGLAMELYETNPQNVSFKFSLQISYEKLGNIHSAFGNLPLALEYYEKERKLLEGLNQADPENVSYKNGLAVSNSKLGEVHTTLGNSALALEYYEKYVQLRTELYEVHPENVSLKNGLAISYSKLGDAHASLGNPTFALEYYEKYAQLRGELYEAHPENVSFKNGLAVSAAKLGAWYSDSDRGKAKKYFGRATEILQDLNTKFPQYVEFKKNLDAISAVVERL